MRYLLLACAGVIGCGEAQQPTTSPATTQGVPTVLAEPSAVSRFGGTLHTIQRLDKLSPLSDLVVTRDVNADWAEKNGAGAITASNLENLLTEAEPVAPDDKLIDQWHYAPWCRGSFTAAGRKWSVALYLGGLGFITDDDGHRGAFRFQPPRSDGR
jgi:hypothetical protein